MTDLQNYLTEGVVHPLTLCWLCFGVLIGAWWDIHSQLKCRHLQMIAPRMAVPKIPTHQWAATLDQSGQVWWVWPVVVEQRPILLAQMWQLFLTPEFGGKQGGSVIKTSSGNGKRGSVRFVFSRNIKKHPLLVARMITHFLERIYESIFLMLGGGLTVYNYT